MASFVALLWAARSAGLAEPAIHWHADVTPPRIEVAGLPAEMLRGFERSVPSPAKWPLILAVFAEQAGTQGMPPIAGAWSVAGERLRFEPRFPLVRGVRYRAEFRAPEVPVVVSYFELPADTVAPSTEVVRIFPTADVLPENQLKFYVQFSAPMSRGGIYDHVKIRDASGQVIDLPFLELDEELWDQPMMRLTLLIDPGRIKRGVKPLEDIGPVFEAGKRYSLTVAATFRDAANRPLRTEHRKDFRIGAADRTPPDPARWRIRAPAAGGREPVVVEFDEPLDQALALRLIRIADGAGGPVKGQPGLTSEEKRWTFTPAQPWPRGPHRLVVQTTIEDLAGNNIGKPFDVDLAEGGPPRRIEREDVTVAFEVR